MKSVSLEICNRNIYNGATNKNKRILFSKSMVHLSNAVPTKNVTLFHPDKYINEEDTKFWVIENSKNCSSVAVYYYVAKSNRTLFFFFRIFTRCSIVDFFHYKFPRNQTLQIWDKNLERFKKILRKI